ncbi:MAG: hypothetical protein JNK48_28540 [Bryobacterales bacterium]|nr:hypothetical protein [Bryobacterales bacterium]
MLDTCFHIAKPNQVVAIVKAREEGCALGTDVRAHVSVLSRMREEGIDFQQSTNAFLKCGNPGRLQELADSLTTRDLLQCGQKWLAAFTPFITDSERRRQVHHSRSLRPGTRCFGQNRQSKLRAKGLVE